MTNEKKAIGSICLICKAKDIPLTDISKTIPNGHGRKWLFWHEENCKDDQQGAIEKVDVEYWDLIKQVRMS